MTRRLLALNLLLVVLIGAACWRMRVVWLEQERASAQFFARPAAAGDPPVVLIPEPPKQVMAMSYLEVAQQLMFSRDRNPTVIVEVEAPKPMPALPLYYGMINLGDGPKVVLAGSRGAGQRSYRAGQQIGDFKLLAIEPTGLVFEWDGKRVPASYAQLKDTQPVTPQPPRSATTPSSGPQPPKPATSATSIGSQQISGPGESAGSDRRMCQAGDTSPEGAVVNGFRKVLAATPFGKSCYWEKVR
ncbi:MAG: hypothetical protein C0504_18570 [Candidatus Solibacter sp.]|nr:hypothetical protein [Candidatus Solibacter sp.]